MVGYFPHDGWSSVGVSYSGLSVTYDTPRADPATTDATVTRDCLAGRQYATHDPSQHSSEQHGRSCSPSQLEVREWSPFCAVPAPRYLGNSSIFLRIAQVSCLISCLPERPALLLFWLQLLTQRVSGQATYFWITSELFPVRRRQFFA